MVICHNVAFLNGMLGGKNRLYNRNKTEHILSMLNLQTILQVCTYIA